MGAPVHRLVVAAIAIAAIVGVTESATRNNFPPLFEENPNLRAAIEPRADVPDYRLPNNTEPISYDIVLTTQVHTGETAFTGTVKIQLTVVEDTRTIVLHSRQQANFVAEIYNTAIPSTVWPLSYEYEEEREFLSLSPVDSSATFAKDTEWLLTISYTAELRTDNGGFYLSTYTDDNNTVHYLATTQFESTDARHGFPCYDEPAKRANFTITIHHDPSFHAISNMPVDEAKSDITNGITAFETTVNMPSYLVAFIVSDFESTEGVLNSLTQRIFSRRGTQNEQEWALVSGMLITERLAEYYGIPFALPKLDQVAVPDFAAGAMENWGLATYREEYLLYNKDTSTVNTQTNIANIIAHEYCHQWFGNLVAVKWWTYLWLKEGFATLFSYQATDEAYPEWDIFQIFHASDYQSALGNDATISSRPMTHYVQAPSEISLLYNYVSYAKAGSVLRMWQHALTNNVFKAGLHKYLSVNQYSAAEEWDLFEALQSSAKDENYAIPDTMDNMMSSWTHQAGYPLLTVERNYATGTFTVKQSAYFNSQSVQQTKSWYIPFNYVDQSNADFRNTEATHYLLNVTEMTISNAALSNDSWLILNKQSTGYFRINYDEQNWNLIIAGLISQPYKIHPHNRAQLMSDAYRLSTSNGILSHSVLLNIMQYLTQETEYAPWSMANSIITVFNRYLSADEDYEQFLEFVSDLVTPMYEKLGVNDRAGDHHLQKYTRSIAINIACLARDPNCLQETNNKLSDFMENGIAIEPNLQSQTYCNGLRQSGDDVFNFVYSLLMTSDDQAQRRILISALGCTQNEEQIQKFIGSSIDHSNELRTQERTTLLSPVYSRGDVGILACIDFLDQNWEAYSNLTSGFGGVNPVESDIQGISAYVTNEEQKTKLLALVEKVNSQNIVASTLQATVEANIDANFEWLSSNRDPIMNWISEMRTGAGVTASASFLTIAMAIALLISRLF